MIKDENREISLIGCVFIYSWIWIKWAVKNGISCINYHRRWGNLIIMDFDFGCSIDWAIGHRLLVCMIDFCYNMKDSLNYTSEMQKIVWWLTLWWTDERRKWVTSDIFFLFLFFVRSSDERQDGKVTRERNQRQFSKENVLEKNHWTIFFLHSSNQESEVMDWDFVLTRKI